MNSKSFDYQCNKLIELIYQFFEDKPYPKEFPIGAKQCSDRNINYGVFCNNETEEVEIIFRGGTEELYYKLAYDPDQTGFNDFIKQHSPLHWREMTGERLANWSSPGDYFNFMPAANAYYLPSYIVTYAPAFYKEIPGLPCYYDAAYNPLKLLLSKYREIPDEEIWSKVKNISETERSKYLHCLPSGTDSDTEYLIFLSCFNDAQKQVIYQFIEYVSWVLKSQGHLGALDQKDFTRLKAIWQP
jgi:hypothetical protein